MLKRQLLAASALVGASLLTTNAFAQDTNVIEELVVTAEKREQSLQDVPVAVTAFTDERREVLGLATAQDLTNFTPGLNYNTGNDRMTMRGIGRLTNNRSSEGGVALYNDNLYTSSVYSFAKSSLFVDRTEILRGPQGTLYGRNAIGGAMNVISKRPTSDFYAEVRATAANYDRQTLEAATSGPLFGNTRFRLAGSYDNQHKGYYTNIAGGPSEGARGEVWFAEVQLDGQITDRLDWWVKHEMSRTAALGRGAGGRQGITVGLPNISTALQPGTTPGSTIANFNRTRPLASADCDNCFESDTPNTIKIDSQNFTAQVSFHADNFDVRYIGGRTWYHYRLQTDVDGTANSTPLSFFPPCAAGQTTGCTPGAPGGPAGAANQVIPTAGAVIYPRLYNLYDEEPLWFSNEINFASTHEGPVQWLAGLYQFREEANYTPTDARVADDPRLETPATTAGARAAANPTRLYATATSRTRSESYAVFGQVDWSLGEQFIVHAGARYTWDKKTAVEGARLLCYFSATCSVPAVLRNFPVVDITSSSVGTAVGVGAVNPATGQYTDRSQITPVTLDPNGFRYRTLQNSWEGEGATLGLDWKPDGDTLVYGKYTRGYKAGGFNSATTTLSASVTTKKEVIDAFEVGAKKNFMGNLQVNASAFYYDYQDIQAVIQRYDEFLRANVSEYTNLPKATIKGFELETIWQPINNLQINANYSYLDGEVKEGCCFVDPEDPMGGAPGATPVAATRTATTVGQDLKGQSLSGSTPHRVAVNVNYTWELANLGDLTASLNYSWRDTTYFSVFNRDYNKGKAYEQIDARVLLNDADDRFTVIGFVRNLTDVQGQVVVSGTRLTNPGPNFGRVNKSLSFIAPRTYGVEVQYRF
jgi:iron complex outermembrane receptor protein